MDAEMARDLGYAAVTYLLNGGSGAMITIQGGEFLPIPFKDLLDESSGVGRRRPVDVDTESYQVARDYMVRLNNRDFSNEEWMQTLAEAGAMSVSDFQEKFGHQNQASRG
jgi:6-phosphofructokinase 1